MRGRDDEPQTGDSSTWRRDGVSLSIVLRWEGVVEGAEEGMNLTKFEAWWRGPAFQEQD